MLVVGRRCARRPPQRATSTASDARETARGRSCAGEDAEHDELEAAREAKYREIRDAELDYRTGKLSRARLRASSDAELRAEALEILDALEAGVRPRDA